MRRLCLRCFCFTCDQNSKAEDSNPSSIRLQKVNEKNAEPVQRISSSFGAPPRQRVQLAIAMALVVIAGLASRSFPFLFPATLGKYPGDALWAMMVLFGVALLKPSIPPARLALLALAITCIVELSQLYQAPWLNAIRATTAGHLVLGSNFDWLDLSSYTVGIIAGFSLDVVIFHRVRAAREIST